MRNLLVAGFALTLVACTASAPSEDSSPEIVAPNILEGAWDETQTRALLDKTMRLRFPYENSGLTLNEQEAVKELLSAGTRLHSLYLEQRHPQGRAAEMTLADLNGREDLKEVFRIMKGPIATNLENKRVPFLNVSAPTDAGNVYPIGTDRETMEAFLDANPDQKNDILHLRAVVKSASEAEKAKALATLKAYPALDVLHPGLRAKIETAKDYFALPYSVEYAEDIFFIYDRLNAAAKHIEGEDIAFARFLKARARDILADDYDGGDAAWITGEFTGNLNAQIGSYETYDDALYGVKSYFSLSLLQRDKVKSYELAASIGDIQAIEDALPYEARKKVRSNIPVGVYNIISDFGQARGTNTATILPNEGHLSRQYGRTILIRSTVLTNERIFAEALTSFKAAVLDTHHEDLVLEGNFYRTLWHEIGHYLGPDQTKSGGDIDSALRDSADLLEEMKADLVSLFSVEKLNKSGAFSDQQLRAIYAAGILRVLQKNRPRRSQAYGTMQLIQWNWFMDHGLLSFNDGKLEIHYEHYSKAVSTLLSEVLDLQYQGDRDTANAFIDKWTGWDEDMHGVIAAAMKDAEGARYRYVTYEALGE